MGWKALIVLAGLVVVCPAHADVARRSGNVLVDVRSAAASGSTVFVATTSVRRAARYATYDPVTSRMLEWPEIRSSGTRLGIATAVSDGSGGWYLAGTFDSIGGVGLPGFAHVTRERTVDRSFEPPTIVVPTEIVVGPRLVFGRTRQGRLVALDRRTGHAVWIPGYRQVPCTFIERQGSRLISYELPRSGAGAPRIVTRSLVDGSVLSARPGRHLDPSYEGTEQTIGRFLVTSDATGVVLRVTATGKVFRRYRGPYGAFPYAGGVLISRSVDQTRVRWTLLDASGNERHHSTSRIRSFTSLRESRGRLWGCVGRPLNIRDSFYRSGFASISPESGAVRWIEDVEGSCVVESDAHGSILLHGMRSLGPYTPGGIAAFDARTLRRTTWRPDAPKSALGEPFGVTVDNGTVYVLATYRISAFDERSGALRWSVPNTVPDYDHTFTFRGSIAVRDSHLIVASASTLRSFNTTTGKLQWRLGAPPKLTVFLSVLATSQAFVTSADQSGSEAKQGMVDLASGTLTLLPTDPKPSQACGTMYVDIAIPTIRTREAGSRDWTTLTDQLTSEQPSEVESVPALVGCDARRLYLTRIAPGHTFELVAVDRATGAVTRVADGAYFGPAVAAHDGGITTVREGSPEPAPHETPQETYELIRIDDQNVERRLTAPILGKQQSVLLVETYAGAVMIIDPAQTSGSQGGLIGVDD